MDVYRQAEYDLLAKLATAVDRGVVPDGGDVRAAQEASRLSGQAQAIAVRLTERIARAAPPMLLEAVLWGGRQAIADLNRLLGPAGRDYESDLNRRAIGLLGRSLSDTLTPVHLSITRVIDDAYKAISGRAAVGTLTGANTRRDAAQRALNEYARRGINGFTDASGRRWSMTSYAEMSVRAATQRAAVDSHVERMAAEGMDLVYVSNSPRECPLCRPWESKILTTTGPAGRRTIRVQSRVSDEWMTVEVAGSLDEARRAGLMHPNCTHSVSAYLPGATTVPENTENPQGYEERQHLRYLERGVRAAKREQAAAMDAAAQARAAEKVARWQGRIREHVDTTGLIRQRNREQIDRAI